MATTRCEDSHFQYKSVSVRREGLTKVSRYCSERPYVALRVPEEISTVRSIVFKILSHDQGFSDRARKFGGTYEHSYPWLEAVALTPIGHDRIPRRVLQYNVHASLQFRRHEIRSDYEDADVFLRSWLGAIRGGDTLQIIAKAQYQAWINFIQEAEIELHGMQSLQDISLPRISDELALRNVSAL